MTSWRNTKLAFCPGCAKERPVVKGKGKTLCRVCLGPVTPPRLKYGNVPTLSRHTGRRFQSKKEANREPALLAEQNAGFITDLRYQVPFRLELYSTQAVDALLLAIEERHGPDRHPRLVNDVIRSRQCVAVYKADFTYLRDGRLVVEDPKGERTDVYRIKKKLMVLAHNIEIQEPSDGGVQQKARGAGIRGRGTGARFIGGR